MADAHSLCFQRNIDTKLDSELTIGNPKDCKAFHPSSGVASTAGYSDGIWGSFRQWKTAGAQVRKGEKSTPVIFYKQVTKENEDGDEAINRILKYSSVFNADQVDGWNFVEPMAANSLHRNSTIEAMINESGARIVEGGAQAFYKPASDTIHMPDPSRFVDGSSRARFEAFYAVLLHEMTHWTGHPNRCDRDLRHRFGSEAYAMEELVAELGSAFLCARLHISSAPREDHAQYLANWLKVLKGDKKAIFTAAAKAQEAADYLL